MYAEAERRGISSAWNGVRGEKEKRKFIQGRARWVRSKEGGIWLRPATRTKSREVQTGVERAVLGDTGSSVLCLLSVRCRQLYSQIWSQLEVERYTD